MNGTEIYGPGQTTPETSTIVGACNAGGSGPGGGNSLVWYSAS